MNLYIRYFQSETIVKSVDEAMDYLASIPEIKVDEYLYDDLRQFAESPVMYPKRYKVRGKSYFIVIKTPFDQLEEFKQEGERKRETQQAALSERRDRLEAIMAEQVGWYQATINFKRVVTMPETGKFQYADTPFTVRLKATSVQDCYNRIIDHLRSRPDVDPRSQFPSVKKKDFQCTYLGMTPDGGPLA